MLTIMITALHLRQEQAQALTGLSDHELLVVVRHYRRSRQQRQCHVRKHMAVKPEVAAGAGRHGPAVACVRPRLYKHAGSCRADR